MLSRAHTKVIEWIRTMYFEGKIRRSIPVETFEANKEEKERVYDHPAFSFTKNQALITRKVDGTMQSLTPIEFRLLSRLTEHPNWITTHHDILEAVYPDAHFDGMDTEQEKRLIKPHVLHLRAKIGDIPGENNNYSIIVAKPGLGYILVDSSRKTGANLNGSQPS